MGDALDLVESLAAGQLSAVEATEAAIARIDAGDGPVHAVIVRDFDRALEQAALADARLADGERAPLLGVPMTVKESLDVAGLATTWGQPVYRDHVATSDAVVVDRLKAAGAIIVGKTNVSPALADIHAANEVYGVTHNPHRYDRSAGGSSGGAAAALAAGFVPLEVGSDIGGSIRIPAGFCGVWGLKPTHGLVNSKGHYIPGTDGADPPLGVVGPLARSADDVALLLSVLADHPLPAPRLDPSVTRVAVLVEHPISPVAADVAAAIDRTAAAMEVAGMKVDRAPQLPDLVGMHKRYMKLLNIVLARGIPQTGRQPVTLVEWYDLVDEQSRSIREWEDLLTDRYDLVLAPTFATTAFEVDDLDIATRTIDIDGTSVPCATQLAWAGLATYPNLPSIGFPAGSGSDGMPIGLQLIGRRFSELDLLAAAERVSTPVPASRAGRGA